jgi:transcription-repair coupling factor (superfamily II helicase)
VDEEQKFGVAQKEYLKQARPSVDVLALSATPIPRTLSMSLSGLRGLSILRTPPIGRLPVETYIADYSPQKLQKAVVEELARGGQVYIVHNRVQSLPLVRRHILEQLEKVGITTSLYEETPNEGPCVVALAHGQMDVHKLGETMSDFLAGKIQVLVASSIVEHGLDSPGANTLIVLHSEWFGLSDLYQLRGRVGRRQIQAHAHFFVGGIDRDQYSLLAEWAQISDTARKRLEALKEADELGSGWSVAIRDLEIRGGGNILGHEQHGSMEAIGLLLYGQLLQEEIGRQARLQGLNLFQGKED